MNFRMNGRDSQEMGLSLTSLVRKTKNAILNPDVQDAVTNGPAGQAVFSVLPSGAKTLLRKGASILSDTEARVTSAVQKRAANEVNTNMQKAGLWTLAIVGLGAGAYALSRRK